METYRQKPQILLFDGLQHCLLGQVIEARHGRPVGEDVVDVADLPGEAHGGDDGGHGGGGAGAVTIAVMGHGVAIAHPGLCRSHAGLQVLYFKYDELYFLLCTSSSYCCAKHVFSHKWVLHVMCKKSSDLFIIK